MTSTATTAQPVAIDVNLMLKAVRELQAMADHDPIGDWMRSQGCDPDRGYLLVLPSSMFALAGAFPPAYVLCSTLALEPTIILPPPTLHRGTNLRFSI